MNHTPDLNDLHPALKSFKALRKAQRCFEDDYKLFKAVMADNNESAALWDAFTSNAMLVNVVNEGVANRINMLCESIAGPDDFESHVAAYIGQIRQEQKTSKAKGLAGKALRMIHETLLEVLGDIFDAYLKKSNKYRQSYHKAS